MVLAGKTILTRYAAVVAAAIVACCTPSAFGQEQSSVLTNPLALNVAPADDQSDTAAADVGEPATLNLPTSLVPIAADEPAPSEPVLPQPPAVAPKQPGPPLLPVDLAEQYVVDAGDRQLIQSQTDNDIAGELSEVLSPPAWPAVDLSCELVPVPVEPDPLLDITWGVECPSAVLPANCDAVQDPSRQVRSMLGMGTAVPANLHHVPDRLVHARSIDAGEAELAGEGAAGSEIDAKQAEPNFVVDRLEAPVADEATARLASNTASVAQTAGAEVVGPAPHYLHHCPAPCSTVGPYSPCPVNGFHCVGCCKCRGLETKLTWQDAGPIPWEAFGHGEYIGPARQGHVPEYRLRVDDILDFVFRLTRDVSSSPYRLEVGDRVLIESLTSPIINREVIIQSDGTITLRNLQQVPAAGRTIDELRQYLDEAYSKFITDPQITATPVETNTKLTELIAAVDNRFGQGGQQRPARVTPEGTVQLPAIGSVPAQGLTLDELQREIQARYTQIVDGLEVTPILQERAPRYVFVVGEVTTPGRYTLEGPTTAMQSIALAGSWNIGADLRHVVVFRRDENWNLMATRLNLRPPLYGRSPCPADEIWLRDSDIVLVPKHPILTADDAIDLIFTRGIYSVFPVGFSYQLRNFSTIP